MKYFTFGEFLETNHYLYRKQHIVIVIDNNDELNLVKQLLGRYNYDENKVTIA